MRCCLLVLLTSALFAQNPRHFIAPEVGNANLPAQRIGANDLIAVTVYDAPELSRTVRVGSDGVIRIPMLKQGVRAEGALPAELETRITKALSDEQILVQPFVTVTVAEYNSRPISVVGAVKKPVTFQAVGRVTLLEALARAEGLNENAGREILLTQPGADGRGLTKRIPVRGLIDQADPDLNLELKGGEEIRVPDVGKIYVVGNVKKPGAFKVQDGSETTVLQMLALAEGVLPFATEEAYIYRREASGNKSEIPLPLEKIIKRRSPDVPLAANDILYIPDNKRKRLSITALDRIASFGAGTVSGLVIWRGR